MSAIFLSDVHLRDATSVKTQLVLRFLSEKAANYHQIFILGDLFDVWPGTNSFLIDRFRPVTDRLHALVKEGHEVHYVEGNHDFRLGRYFSEHLGIHTHPDEFITEMGGKKLYLAHGDLGNPKDIGYRILRSVLRQDLLHLAMKAVPGKFIFDVGMKSSMTSRAYQDGRFSESTASRIRQTYRQTAEKLFRSGFDMVVMGHTHLPDDVSTIVNERSCRYINTGDWVRHFSYLEFDGQQFYTRSHPVKDL